MRRTARERGREGNTATPDSTSFSVAIILSLPLLPSLPPAIPRSRPPSLLLSLSLSLIRANVTPRMLCSSSERRLALPSASTAIQTILICSSTLVERTAYHYQSRGVPLYLQEAFEDPTLQRAPPFLNWHFDQCLTCTYSGYIPALLFPFF